MSEQERMDNLLRKTMAAPPVHGLSSNFEERLMKRTRPRRLSASGRWLMAVYAIVALIVSVWAMRAEAIDWSIIAIAVLVPLTFAVTVQLRHRA